jgi:formate hydrogenlyase subunit 4
MRPALLVAAHVSLLLLAPILFVGLINRTKALWAGRRGPRLMQLAFDLMRLLRKRPVYSEVTTAIFQLGPLVVLATAIVSGLIVPLLGSTAPMSFPYDFVAVAYLWGLGRIFLMLAALDTGGAFEGMGASRDATFATMAEPTLFLVLGTLATVTGQSSFQALLHPVHAEAAFGVVPIGCLAALLVVLQVESARVPVDDPSTHLELTMVHEVMILDHSGPELAALQYGSAIKATLCAALLAGLVNPLPSSAPPEVLALVQLALLAGVAITIGTIESLVARFRLRVVPQFVVIALLAAFVALLSGAFAKGAAG